MNKEDKEKMFGKAIPQIIHDIRNPLNIIIGFSSILQLDDSINEEVRSYLKNIILSGMHIEQLLSNIDYFMMDTLDLPIVKVNLKKEYSIFLSQHIDNINEKRVIINCDIDENLEFHLPEGIFTRILDNLFHFSMKGLKSISSKQININIIALESTFVLYYHDTSSPVFIEGEYFTFEETIKGKRSLAPLFIEKLIHEYGGEVRYFYGNKWATEIEEHETSIKTQHGFKIQFPYHST